MKQGPYWGPDNIRWHHSSKVCSPWRTGSQDVWTPTLRNLSLLTYLHFFYCNLSPLALVLRSTPPNHLRYLESDTIEDYNIVDWQRQSNTQNFSMGWWGRRGLILRPRIIYVWFWKVYYKSCHKYSCVTRITWYNPTSKPSSRKLVEFQRKLKKINLLAPELFFFNLAHSVYKMWIIQEPNMLELWNKLHFEEKKTESI